MIIPVALLIVVAVFMAVTLAFLGIFLIVRPTGSTLEARLRGYSFGTGVAREEELSRPFSERVIIPFFSALGRFLSNRTPSGVVSTTSTRLIQAGIRSQSAPLLFFGAKLVGLVVLPILFFVGHVLVAKKVPSDILPLIVQVFTIYLGWRLPDIWLDSAVSGRQKTIEKTLPDALDLISVCIEAGMGLEAALSKVGEKFQGPIADEFGMAVYEMSLGRRRREALRAIGERSGAPDLVSFVAAVIKADQTGVNIGDVLRVQADALRVRRRQRAQEQAVAAPVKMLFPLILFIFPALFVVILGPAALNVYRTFFAR